VPSLISAAHCSGTGVVHEGRAMAPSQRVAVVTGGGRGIGRGIVSELAALGLSIVVNYRSDGEAAEVSCLEAKARGAADALAVRADIADIADGRRLLETVLTTFGRVDLFVNNAGIAPASRLDLLDTTTESWDRVLDTNLRGPFFLTQAVARAMGDLVGRGTLIDPQIVFVTSVSSTFASVNRGEYCVSKAGLSMVARLFAVRLAELGIRVYEIRPGVIETDMTGPVRALYERRISEGLSPIRRWGTPADVGKAVAALASGALAFSTGEVIHVDGGLHIDRL
jgi:NAD(P)-dependent dehydrogenase (short-subunit alcohol dehydrogenase family)